MIAVIGPVVMDVTRLLAFEGTVVRDASDTDYLFTKVIVSLEGVVGIGSGQSWEVVMDSNVGPLPVQRFGRGSGITSFVALRHALSQRQPFILFEPALPNGQPQVLLFSDGKDANNGPKPLDVSVLSVHGGGMTAFVRYTVEIAINECPQLMTNEIGGNRGEGVLQGGPPRFNAAGGGNGVFNANGGFGMFAGGGEPMLLSNRWETGVQYDPEDQSVTYTLQGRATFRRDALDRFFTTTPDEYRFTLLPPPVVNCKRFIDDIKVASDGLTLEYTIRDVEQIRNYLDYKVDAGFIPAVLANPQLPVRHVAKVDVVVEKTYGQLGISKLVDHALAAFQSIQFANPISSGGGDALGIQQGAKDLAKTGLNFVVGVYKTVDSMVPYYNEAATARVQLTRHGTMADGQRLAYALISGALNYGNGQGFLDKAIGRRPVPDDPTNLVIMPPMSVTLKYSPTGAWVEASMSIERSGLLDFMSLGTPAGISTMMQPLKDDLIGGQIPWSLASLAGLAGLAPARILDILQKVGAGWGKNFKEGKVEPDVNDEEAKKLFEEFGGLNLESEQFMLLVTNRNAMVVGPDADFYSRSLSDVLVRAAAALLSPCQTPIPATGYILPPPRRPGPHNAEPGVRQPVPNRLRPPLPRRNQPNLVPADLINKWKELPKTVKGFFDPFGQIK